MAHAEFKVSSRVPVESEFHASEAGARFDATKTPFNHAENPSSNFIRNLSPAELTTFDSTGKKRVNRARDWPDMRLRGLALLPK